MATERQSRTGILLIGLPVLSNIVSFIIFAPLFAPGRTASPADFQRASILIGIAILVIEVLAVLLIALFLSREHAPLNILERY